MMKLKNLQLNLKQVTTIDEQEEIEASLVKTARPLQVKKDKTKVDFSIFLNKSKARSPEIKNKKVTNDRAVPSITSYRSSFQKLLNSVNTFTPNQKNDGENKFFHKKYNERENGLDYLKLEKNDSSKNQKDDIKYEKKVKFAISGDKESDQVLSNNGKDPTVLSISNSNFIETLDLYTTKEILNERAKKETLLLKLISHKIGEKYQAYCELLKKAEILKNEFAYLNDYRDRVLCQTVNLEKELEYYKSKSVTMTLSNTLQNRKSSTFCSMKTTPILSHNYFLTDFNNGPKQDLQNINQSVEELELKISALKVNVAEVKEKMDNINDDFYSNEKMNAIYKQKVRLQEKEFEDLKSERDHLKNILKDIK